MKSILTTAAAALALTATAALAETPQDRCAFYKAPNGNYLIRAGAECGWTSSAGDHRTDEDAEDDGDDSNGPGDEGGDDEGGEA